MRSDSPPCARAATREALRETDRLRQEVARLEGIVGGHREQEKSLQSTLLTAQKLADEIKDNAQKEASLVVREAEGQRDLILQKAQARFEDVQREIEALRMKRREVENELEGLVRTLNTTLEFIREQDERARDERILLHRPRAAELPPIQSAQSILPKADTGS